jgi:hypothetical protein
VGHGRGREGREEGFVDAVATASSVYKLVLFVALFWVNWILGGFLKLLFEAFASGFLLIFDSYLCLSYSQSLSTKLTL